MYSRAHPLKVVGTPHPQEGTGLRLYQLCSSRAGLRWTSMASAGGGREFPAFPFEPYPIQLQLMRAVHVALQKGGVAIVESPTGTGKTLSLICSVLQWLQDQQQSVPALSCPGAAHKAAANDEPDWMRDFAHEVSKLQPKASAISNTTRVFRDAKNFFLPQHAQDQRAHEKVGLPCTNLPPSLDDDEDFLLKDYDSGSDCDSFKAKKRNSLKDMADDSTDDSADEEEGENEQPLKVFFCSRTHSQLSQFVKELQRTAFSTALKTISLGSRKSLCINPEVAKLKYSFRINERCLELQRSKNTKSAGKKVLLNGGRKARRKAQGCPMMGKQSHQRAFKEMAWESEVLDIEDLVKLGEKLGTCPYYASRRMVPLADLVVLPYQSMLHCPTRDAIGLKLKGCVVVIDEAHNLVDSISNMHGCQVSEVQLRQVQSLLNAYLAKFRELLGAGNRRYIQILLLLVQALLNQIATAENTADVLNTKLGDDFRANGDQNEKKNGKILTINDFLFLLDIDNINMFKLWQYMKESNIVHKVSSYAEKVGCQEASLQSVKQDHGKITPNITGPITSFHALAELILALMNADTDGRVLIVPHSGSHDDSHGAHIKFVLLNAARAFMEVVDQAHAVILAGGTLQPVEELRYRLFPYLHENRIHHFSCGHIVPAENVLAIAVARGPTGKLFDFTFQSRSLPETMEELGRLLFNICLVVPEGVVVFLPSFDYEQQLHSAWKGNGILEKLERRKALFREPKDAASVELTLQEYKEAVEGAGTRAGRTGAILLCIVGGKMSEGINFSDGMGRCVIMVGLPYPCPTDPELMERMNFINKLSNLPSATIDQSSYLPPLHYSAYRGRDYYENLCMKAVNQSIGRAIRHMGDYASILLVDARYTPSPSSSAPSRQATKLPSWIKDRLFSVTGNFGEVQKLLHHFFKGKASHTS